MAKVRRVKKFVSIEEAKVGHYFVVHGNVSGHSFNKETEYRILEIKDKVYFSGVDKDGDERGSTHFLKDRYEIYFYVSEKKRDRSLFDILVLPGNYKKVILDTVHQTNESVSERIFVEWGFGETIEKGKGIIMLLWGPPGTGKTMCAEAIAELLNKDFIMLGNKDIQSSIPGQTERNIGEAFKKATKDKAVLILDECDSLVYNRDSVGAILASEINALLTEIERFEGVCILTTNRSQRLDRALERRVCLKLEFPKPDMSLRGSIWRNLIPKKAPLHKDVNFSDLSRYELTGGQIKNAILAGARTAAARNKDGIVHMDLLEGIERELLGEKMWQRSTKDTLLGTDFIKTVVQQEVKKEKDKVGGNG